MTSDFLFHPLFSKEDRESFVLHHGRRGGWQTSTPLTVRRVVLKNESLVADRPNRRRLVEVSVQLLWPMQSFSLAFSPPTVTVVVTLPFKIGISKTDRRTKIDRMYWQSLKSSGLLPYIKIWRRNSEPHVIVNQVYTNSKVSGTNPEQGMNPLPPEGLHSLLYWFYLWWCLFTDFGVVCVDVTNDVIKTE